MRCAIAAQGVDVYQINTKLNEMQPEVQPFTLPVSRVNRTHRIVLDNGETYPVWAVHPSFDRDEEGNESFDEISFFRLQWNTQAHDAKTDKPLGAVTIESRDCGIDEKVKVLPQIRFSVATHKLPNLIKKIEKLNRKAVKRNLPEIYFMEGATTVTKVRCEDDEHVWYEYHSWTQVTVIGEAPSYNGWKPVGILEHITDDATLVYNIGDNLVPGQFRTSGHRCEHCNTNRARKKTMVILHDDGTHKQIGLQCAKDFVGDASASAIVGYATMWEDLFKTMDDLDGDYSGGNRQPLHLPVEEYLAWVSFCIEAFGWISRSKCGAKETATADMALDLMVPQVFDKNQKILVEDDIERGKEALAWVHSLDGHNDFEHNLKTLASLEHFPVKKAGFVAYMLQGCIVAKAKAIEATEQQKHGESNHVGEVGDKVELELDLEFHRFFPGRDDFDVDKDMFKFRDADGNVFVWWTTSDISTWIETGCTYIIRGRIKGHTTYNSVKQTMLTNCVLPQVKDADWDDRDAFMAAARGEKGSLAVKTDGALIGTHFEIKDGSNWEVVSQYDYDNGSVFARKLGKRSKMVGKKKLFQQREVKITQMAIGA